MAAEKLRRTYRVIDPSQYFDDWHFDIRPELITALGVSRREYVDREKTRLLRAAAQARGTPADRLAQVKHTYFAYAVGDPPEYDFHEGDVFYSRHGPTLQVAVPRAVIEVHVLHSYTYLGACRVTAAELAEWLRTGVEPEGKRISRNESWRELAKFHILPPDDNWLKK